MVAATQFNPVGLSFADLYALFARMRETSPVYHWAEYDCWVFSRGSHAVS